MDDAVPTPGLSVCMATYDGSAYVLDQLASILAQLGPGDEVIVADDSSTDGTAEIVAGLGDERVVLLRNDRNLGHVRTFERALRAARGEVLFLADQDDLWVEGRVVAMVDALDRRPVVAGNVTVFGTRTGPHTRALLASDSGAGLRNLLGILAGRRPYFGSAMALRREVLPLLLPIPPYVESHDVWLAMLANLTGGVEHLEQPVLLRRLHGSNLTTPRRRGLPVVAISRLHMVRAVVAILRRRRHGAGHPAAGAPGS